MSARSSGGLLVREWLHRVLVFEELSLSFSCGMTCEDDSHCIPASSPRLLARSRLASRTNAHPSTPLAGLAREFDSPPDAVGTESPIVELDEFDLTALQAALVIPVSLILLHSSPYTLDKPQLRETLITWRCRDFGPGSTDFGNWYIVSISLVVFQHVRGMKS